MKMTDPGNNLCFHEDSSLKLGDSIESICFHHSLNVFLVTTTDKQIKVFDSHSAAQFTSVHYSAGNNNGKYGLR